MNNVLTLFRQFTIFTDLDSQKLILDNPEAIRLPFSNVSAVKIHGPVPNWREFLYMQKSKQIWFNSWQFSRYFILDFEWLNHKLRHEINLFNFKLRVCTKFWNATFVNNNGLWGVSSTNSIEAWKSKVTLFLYIYISLRFWMSHRENKWWLHLEVSW